MKKQIKIQSLEEILNKESYIEIPTSVVVELIPPVIIAIIFAYKLCKNRK